MKILWLTWKDLNHPTAGGAERMNEEIAKRLVRDGHEVVFLVGGFPGGSLQETRDGFKIIRLGNRYTLYPKAFGYYHRYLRDWPDLIVEEINTVPFFTKFYAQQKKLLFFHQLCREIWFYQQTFPLSLFGYLTEPFYLRLLNNLPTVAVSQSTCQDLMRFGYKKSKIHLIVQGNPLTPVAGLGSIRKFPEFTLLSLGALRTMKRVDHQLKAFEVAKAKIPELRLIVVGKAEDEAGRKVEKLITQSPFQQSIEYRGYFLPESEKTELIQKAHLILGTSVKEGWGMFITEAASQGTPAVVYDVDGLRESVQHEKTGLISLENSPVSLAGQIVRLYRNQKLYQALRQNAWEYSQKFSYEQSYQDFLDAVKRV